MKWELNVVPAHTGYGGPEPELSWWCSTLESGVPGGQLTPEQRAFHKTWAESRIAIVTTPEAAIAAARACTGEGE